MKDFEAIVIISSDTTKNNLVKIDESFQKLINEQNGSIVAKENWGLRDLAYEIKSMKKGFYLYYQLNLDGQKIINIKKNISQNEKILRYLFIKVESHEKLPTKVMQTND
tara:strand:+ start:229 stop:555 length:327 start_codon:yes stop_codon:yes gene_type:complete